ncbi:MAG: carbohydrate ABC transporter substrate-binding protein, partial [Eubacteriales bacterium]|nr:carbohydrate ABC transporter substrate-binding protein [Eubacteriales bacterium]
MKKTIAIILSLVLTLAMFSGCTPAPAAAPAAAAPATETATEAPAPAEEPAAAGDKVINIYTFTDEVPKMLDKYVAAHPDFGYTINATIIATTDGLYQPALDQALAAGGKDAPDMYCAESAFVLKYTQGDMSSYAAKYSDLGIDVAAATKAADIAQYTIDIGTRPSDSALVGLGYQATGGAFIYRRSLAIDTWGSDDPAVVKDKIGPGWDKFYAAAADLKAKGYGIVSGDGDIWHAVENSSPTGWIVDGKLNIDPARESFLDLSMKLKEGGFYNDTRDWTDAWYADMAGTGAQPIFGFFGPAWLINYVMAGNSGGTAPG